jgi:hypothetical protein
MTETLGDWERPGTGPTRQAEDLALKDALRRDLARLYEEAARIEGALDERLGGGLPRFTASLSIGLPAGMLLGFLAASGSLLLHVIGSLMMDVHPLQIVRAGMSLFMGVWAFDIESGPRLALATCLYLVIGALLGIPLHRMFNRTFAAAPGIWRFLVATAIGMALSIVSFLTPVPPRNGTPFWWTAFTLLAYVWIVLLLENWGRPPQRQAIV